MTNGGKITVTNGVLNVPNHAIIPFIIGDGTGPDIWHAASRVLEAAVEKAYDWREKTCLERSSCRRKSIQRNRRMATTRNS